MQRSTPTPGIEGRVLRRGHEGYEHLRRGAVWHAGVPERFPEVIVLATSEDDVAGAVRLARKEGLQIAVRSGGHSWSGSHLRDGTVLIDLSNLRQVEIDVDAMSATVQPGLRGSELDAVLAPHGLFFPVGHSTGVGLGGYLLQGGFGWAGRDYGPACLSVVGIDAVTADGEFVHADETQNQDLLWAARGAGPGFFAVVTKFHLRLYRRSPVTMNSSYLFSAEAALDVLTFVHEISRRTPLEITAGIFRDPNAGDEPVVFLGGTAFAETEDEAREQLSVLESCPARPQASYVHRDQVTDVAALMSGADGGLIDDSKRWVADNIGTRAGFSDLWPTVKDLIDTWPAGRWSHLAVWNWDHDGQPTRPPMAFSVGGDLFYALYAAWSDPVQDEEHIRWVTDHMQALEPFATGTMLSDENLLHRPARFMSDENLRRLDGLRGEWDPDRLFVSWLGRPELD